MSGSSTWITTASLTALHEPILAAGDTSAAFMGSTYPFLLRAGWTEEQIARAYLLYCSSDLIR